MFGRFVLLIHAIELVTEKEKTPMTPPHLAGMQSDFPGLFFVVEGYKCKCCILSRPKRLVQGYLTDTVKCSEAKLKPMHPWSWHRGAGNVEYFVVTTMSPPAHEILAAGQRVG
jgi:hypothetical protein